MKLVSNSTPLFKLVLLFVALVPATSILARGQSASTDGAALFKAKCAMCHGPDGAGKTPMGQKLNIRDLHSPEVQKQSDAELTHVIALGKGKMPAFSKTLGEDQIKLLFSHIREVRQEIVCRRRPWQQAVRA